MFKHSDTTFLIVNVAIQMLIERNLQAFRGATGLRLNYTYK